eukprot:TRINITY_DN15444_c0_g1_i1.p1 TRINITY_DN15444_c0_g1~~TRINITY_DN15444_c0_g1_i1.p1  ORF type:complete len:306 (-),score=66.88 TRINITY_DN15444_c0_g1_i1:112-1029(-)
MVLEENLFHVERSGTFQGDQDPEEGELRAWSPERRQQEAARRSAAEAFLRAKEENAEQPAPQAEKLRRQRPQAGPRALAVSRPLLHTRHGIFARAVGAAVAQPKSSQKRRARVGDATLFLRSHKENNRQDARGKTHGVRLVRKIRKRKRVREHAHVGKSARKQAALATLRLLDTSAKEKTLLQEDSELRKTTAVFNDNLGQSPPSFAPTVLDERLGNSPQLSNSVDILEISSGSEAEDLPADFMALPVEPRETSPALSDIQEETLASDMQEVGSVCVHDAWLICKADSEELVQAGLRLAHAFAEL